ncbi:MAG: hypothetical protein U5L95_00095 [Candidatus Saccharibacteria bacterium]|nr:hypothetical protein [Candidatus Saccharibacteria bacterium]
MMTSWLKWQKGERRTAPEHEPRFLDTELDVWYDDTEAFEHETVVVFGL